MSALYAYAGMAFGTVLISRHFCYISRMLGAGLVGLSLLAFASPAWADQTIMAADSAQVDCVASARDLTRISLVEDEFASVSKVSGGIAQDDFSVVSEPVRGDIYISVPEGYSRAALSFFGTTKRGYVYKFVCRIEGDEARQVFVSNPAIARTDGENAPAAQASPQEAAVELIQAMFGGRMVDGYEMRQRALAPVQVGTLKVQMIAEYRGPEMSGKVLRIENRGHAAVTLDSATVAPTGALAVSITEPSLAVGQATTAYLVWPNGSGQ